jgi:hypothetical protein
MDEIACILALTGLSNMTVNLSVARPSSVGMQRAFPLGSDHLLTIEWE